MMFRSLLKKSPKVLLIGLDGVSNTLTLDYLKKGYLPELSRILETGHNLYQMDVSIPDVSSTSWTSFMTGTNPGEHGIYGFTDLQPDSYQICFPSSNDIHAPTIWDIIGKTANNKSSTLSARYDKNLKTSMSSVILNIPQTYPALPLNGVLTAGFVCPDLQKGTYPNTAYNYLKSTGYLSDVDANKAKEQKDEFFKEISLSLEKRMMVYEYFMRTESWDLFIGVITETDRLHHFFYEAALDQNHPLHPVFINVYREIDKMIGKMYDRFMKMTKGNGLFMTMSDHGFTVLEKEVYINTWLAQEGFLKLDRQREFFEQIDTGTMAFAMDPARIHINFEGKYPRGTVKEADRTGTIRELKKRFENLVDDAGTSVIKAVYEAAEVYKGPQTRIAPDLVCVANDGFDLKASLQKEHVFGKGHFTGMHTSYDAHCILPSGVDCNQRLHIEQLAGIILEHLLNS